MPGRCWRLCPPGAHPAAGDSTSAVARLWDGERVPQRSLWSVAAMEGAECWFGQDQTWGRWDGWMDGAHLADVVPATPVRLIAGV